MIFINFKVYERGTGSDAIKLTRLLEAVATESNMRIVPVVQSSDVAEIAEITKLEVWAQHIDPVDYGAHTGSVLAEAIKEDGAMGTFLNHSEHKFEDLKSLKLASQRAQEVGLKRLIFASDIDELKRVIKLDPELVSYEPPELVGSKTTSVAEAKPEIIAKAVEVAKKHDLPLIVGAGIKSRADVKTSLKLGASGIAVASDIVASKDPKGALLDLVAGFE